MITTFLPFIATIAMAQAEAVYKIEINDHVMSPSEIKVKAGETFWLEVKNNDNTSEELESNSLKIEKIVGPKRTIKVKIGDIKAGTHDLFGEFNMNKCKGTIVAESAAAAPSPAAVP